MTTVRLGYRARMAKPMKIKSVALKDLLPWPGNARKHNARNLAQIDSSLKSFGQVEPLVVQASTISCG